MKFKYKIKQPEDWTFAIRRIEALRKTPIPKAGFELRIENWKAPRSLDQNAISHVWYAIVSSVEKEYAPDEVKRLCKLHFGVPILRENPDYSQMIEKILGPLSYEDRIAAMDYLRVSSLLTKAQMTQYLEAIQRHYAGRVPLEFPQDRIAA